MLYVVHRCHVVAIIMNLDSARQIRPWPRLVVHLDLIRLHLPGINPREGLVVVAKLKIPSDAQRIDRTRHDTQSNAFSLIVVMLRAVSLPASGIGLAAEPSTTAPAIGPVVSNVQPAGRAPPTRAQSPRAARKRFAAVPVAPPGK